MTIVKTDLGKMRESAKTERFMPSASIRATNVQDAIEAVAAQPPTVNPTIVNVSPYNVTTETYLRVNVAGPVVINLPLTVTRGGIPLTIKDDSSNASANNITINAAGGENIDTLAAIVINQDNGAFNLAPIDSEGTWDII